MHYATFGFLIAATLRLLRFMFPVKIILFYFIFFFFTKSLLGAFVLLFPGTFLVL
jgi:hypothetical protein